MSRDFFISFGQNHEDVVLQRVLSDVEVGTYIEVGGNHPRDDSISRAFYDRGWSGLIVEPHPHFAGLFREERPRDTVVEAAVTSHEGGEVVLHAVAGAEATGLSTLVDAIGERHRSAGFEITDIRVPSRRLDALLNEADLVSGDIHFLVVDTEGTEGDVLASIDLTTIRPWVLVIESTAPASSAPTHDGWEAGVLESGYVFCLFDGVSRFYAAEERGVEFARTLAAPASTLDFYLTDRERRLHDAVDAARRDAAAARNEAEAIRTSRAWRATAPARALVNAIRGRRNA
ncbi:FkbM family methyltransferase [Pseudolysinimonas sp.]|jgi:FkbM family methyltransferase|uniref:FkbM family methyltransferase n=1 Tax=Pseudolysinimonas sp. TaxID=2680009 RepID=UPI003784251B